jgi:beta-1,4-mannosyltransferase
MRARSQQLADFSRSQGRNPYIPLLYEHLAGRGIERVPDARFELGWLWRARRDVTFLHFHWSPHRFNPRRPYRDLGQFAGRLVAARLLGYRVVWTVHELYPPHSKVGRRVDRAAARALARASHLLIAHDRATAARARAELGSPARRVEIVPHASYTNVYPPGRPASAVRAELGVGTEAFVVLAFGMLRPDKGIQRLLEAFAGLDRSDAVLVVAGKAENRELGRLIDEAAAADARIRVIQGFVEKERVAELFEAADTAVFARDQPWTSGALILALSLGVPVIAARVEPYSELVGTDAGWLFDPGEPTSLRAALERAASEGARRAERRAAALARAAQLPTWAAMAEQTATLMRATVRR